MKKIIVEMKNINKLYGNVKIVKNISFSVYEGEFLTILGASGSGKTTTLRMIAGFEEANEGAIFIEGINVKNKAPYERSVNTVFQNYALFPHMNVFDNIAYGLKMKKTPQKQIKDKVEQVLDLIQLKEFGSRKINELSGGQKQRIAIARAIVNKPKVLLLDEPLGALDLKLRKQMQFELKQLQKKIGITFIYVTHDQEEALSMSDRIAIMNEGYLEQIGTPKEIYETPKSRFVAEFIGESNIFSGEIHKTNNNVTAVKTNIGIIYGPASNFSVKDKVCISIRPEKIHLSNTPTDKFSLKGRIFEQVYKGSTTRLIIGVNGCTNCLKIDISSDISEFTVGSEVYISWNPISAILLPEKNNSIINVVPISKMEKTGSKMNIMEKAI